MIDINLWISVLTKPLETFKKHKPVDLGKSFWVVLIPAVIAGIIAGLSNLISFMSYAGYFGAYGFLYIGSAITPFFSIPIFAVIGWLVFSWLVDFVAKSSKRKGKFEEVASLIAIILAPIVIVSSIAIIIPLVGSWLRLLVVLYGLYLVALGLNDYYKLGYNLGFGSAVKKK